MKRIGMLGALLLLMIAAIVGGSAPAQATWSKDYIKEVVTKYGYFCHLNPDGTYSKVSVSAESSHKDLEKIYHEHVGHVTSDIVPIYNKGESNPIWKAGCVTTPPPVVEPPVVVTPEPTLPPVTPEPTEPVTPEPTTPAEPTEPPVTETPDPTPTPEPTEPPVDTTPSPEPTKPPVTDEPTTEPTEPPVTTTPTPDFEEAVPCPGEMINGECVPENTVPTPTPAPTTGLTPAEKCEDKGFIWAGDFCYDRKANNPPAPVEEEVAEIVTPTVTTTTPAAQTTSNAEATKAPAEAAPEGQLAQTGTNGVGILWAGILLIAGAILLLGARRYNNN